MYYIDLRVVRRRGILRNQRGFTLMEVIVASVIALMAIGTINWFSRYQLFSLRNQAVQSDIQMTARSVSDVFARDVRRAGFNPLCAGDISALGKAKTNEVTLRSDLNGDGSLSGVDESLTYRLASSDGQTRLERIANGRTDVLLNGIDSASTRFRFYDQIGNEVTNGLTGLTNAEMVVVQRIRLELAVAAAPVDPNRAAPMQVQLANDVNLRNSHFVNRVQCP